MSNFKPIQPGVLPTSDLLGDLKDEYEDVLKEHPTWYIDEVIAFGPKMYHLILRDKISGEVVKWNKTMKGISLHGDPSRFQAISSTCIGTLS